MLIRTLYRIRIELVALIQEIRAFRTYRIKLVLRITDQAEDTETIWVSERTGTLH